MYLPKQYTLTLDDAMIQKIVDLATEDTYGINSGNLHYSDNPGELDTNKDLVATFSALRAQH